MLAWKKVDKDSLVSVIWLNEEMINLFEENADKNNLIAANFSSNVFRYTLLQGVGEIEPVIRVQNNLSLNTVQWQR